MNKKKMRRKKNWHHRVPDFKLVYCGIKAHKKEPKKLSKGRLEASPQKVG